MFETYGDELDYVHAERDCRPDCVWTITASGEYETLGNGYHYVDRIGYLITEIPCPAGEDYEIVLDEPEFTLLVAGDGYRVVDCRRDVDMCLVNRNDGDDDDDVRERAETILEALRSYV